MRLARGKPDRPVEVADAATAGGAGTGGGARVAREEVIKEFANSRSTGGIGQGWIRTSEGVKPADLQSAPFGHFGTYPLVRAIHIGSRSMGSQGVWGAA